jgi:hypothetical protein
MTVSKFIPLAIFAGLLISNPGFAAGDEKLLWGENVGFVLASVDRIDNEKGLTIRATPSAEGSVLGHLPKGTRILCYNRFKDGWVKLQGHTAAAWVNLKFLKPIPFEGMVTTVDQQDSCLGIRAGPSASREKVGCAQIGEALKFTGVMTTDNWIQLADRRGWISASSVEVSLSASQPVPSSPTTPSAASEGSAQRPSAEKGSGATAPEVKKGDVVMCSGGWCVDYEKAKVTHKGKVVPNTDCFKDTVCAGIVGQHHVAKAILDGSITFGKFKLSSTGAISSLQGDQVANCAEMGGINHKCVANFLSQMIAGVSGGKETPSVSGKSQAAKEQMKNTAGQKTESKKQQSAKKSSGAKRDAGANPNSPVVSKNEKDEQHEREMKMNEEAWENARKSGF